MEYRAIFIIEWNGMELRGIIWNGMESRRITWNGM
jgi:hypothetical protein